MAINSKLIELRAMDIVERHLLQNHYGLDIIDTSGWRKTGYDLWLVDTYKPESKRRIEVKGLSSIGRITLTRYEREAADKFKSQYWLYIVANIGRRSGQLVLHCIPNPIKTIRNGKRVGWNWDLLVYEVEDWMQAVRERIVINR